MDDSHRGAAEQMRGLIHVCPGNGRVPHRDAACLTKGFSHFFRPFFQDLE